MAHKRREMLICRFQTVELIVLGVFEQSFLPIEFAVVHFRIFSINLIVVCREHHNHHF